MKKTNFIKSLYLLLATAVWPLVLTPASADDAKIIEVTIANTAAEHSFRVSVTLEHRDEGWDHYANRWDVLNEKGELLGSRTLHHPHVNEQPFTRSLTLMIPPEVTAITIVASDSVHGDNPDTQTVTVPGR